MRSYREENFNEEYDKGFRAGRREALREAEEKTSRDFDLVKDELTNLAKNFHFSVKEDKTFRKGGIGISIDGHYFNLSLNAETMVFSTYDQRDAYFSSYFKDVDFIKKAKVILDKFNYEHLWG